MGRIASIVYVLIGIAVASNQGYMGDIGSLGAFINLLLAILLWPLLLFGVDFNIKLGGNKGDDKKTGLLLIAPTVAQTERLIRLRSGRSS